MTLSSATMRVISTDYRQTALLYFCHELEIAASCLPGSEGVVILNRDGVTRDHWRVNALVDLVPSGCFRHDDFEWMHVNTGDGDDDTRPCNCFETVHTTPPAS